MKHILLIITFLLLCRVLLAPESRAFFIERAEKINPYKKIIEAVGWVESRHDTLAINWDEYAYGFFQIRDIRVRDYNRRISANYTVNDMLNYRIAEKVFMYYATRIGWRNPEKIARDWNGSGKKTIEYWNKVKREL